MSDVGRFKITKAQMYLDLTRDALSSVSSHDPIALEDIESMDACLNEIHERLVDLRRERHEQARV